MADVKDTDGVVEHAVGDVVFEALEVSAANAGGNFRAGEREAADLRFPILVLGEEGVSELRLGVQIAGGAD